MSVRLIKVKAIPHSGANRVTIEAGQIRVYTTAVAEKDKANKTIIKLLAKYLGKKPSGISILRGRHSREKIIQLSDS